jgi:hypothetical protein
MEKSPRIIFGLPKTVGKSGARPCFFSAFVSKRSQPHEKLICVVSDAKRRLIDQLLTKQIQNIDASITRFR